MARGLMPKTGILMPYVVVNRDAQIVGVNSVDGVPGDIVLTDKYLSIASAAADYLKKTESYNRSQMDARYMRLAAPSIPYGTSLISPGKPEGSAAAFNIDLIKAGQFTSVKDTNGTGTVGVVTENNIIIGDLEAAVKGVHIYSEGRTDVVYTNDAGETRTAPLYSQRYRPEIADMPFAQVGDYIKDNAGRTISVNKTGNNADIKRMTALTNITSQVDFGGKPLKNVGEPVINSDAATASWVNGGFVSKTGDNLITGDLKVLSNSPTKSLSVVNTSAPNPATGITLSAPLFSTRHEISDTIQVAAGFNANTVVGSDTATATWGVAKRVYNSATNTSDLVWRNFNFDWQSNTLNSPNIVTGNLSSTSINLTGTATVGGIVNKGVTNSKGFVSYSGNPANNTINEGQGTNGWWNSSSVSCSYSVFFPDGNSSSGLYVKAQTNAGNYSHSFLAVNNKGKNVWTFGSNNLEGTAGSGPYTLQWSGAPFRVQAGNGASGSASYAPAVAITGGTAGFGYNGGASFGQLTSGSAAFPNPCIVGALNDIDTVGNFNNNAFWSFQVADVPNQASQGQIGTPRGSITPVGSDERIKQDIVNVSGEKSLENIKQMKFKEFAYKWAPDVKRRGVIAQDLIKIDPNYATHFTGMVDGEEVKDLLSPAQYDLLCDALAAIKVLSEKVDKLEKRVEELENANK